MLIFSAKLSFVYSQICGGLFGAILDLKLLFFSCIRVKRVYHVPLSKLPTYSVIGIPNVNVILNSREQYYAAM